MAEYRITYNFYRTLRRLECREQCQVLSALEQYVVQPTHENLERVRVNRNDAHLWRVRASHSTQALVSHYGEDTTFEQVLGAPPRNDTVVAPGAGGADTRRSSGLSGGEFRKLLQSPVEGWEWLIFLDDDQRRAVEASFAGMARVTGAAGTGKTVVALHRAARLASRTRTALLPEDRLPVLFTSYIRSLPPILKGLYRKLPNAIENGVEFTNVDRLANEIVRDHGIIPKIETWREVGILERVRNRLFPNGTGTRQLDVDAVYLHEEIECMIKGRVNRDGEFGNSHTTAHELYLTRPRAGRGRSFSPLMRERIWQLYQAYQSELVRLGLMTYADVARMALELQKVDGKPWYSSAIVDEAQDFTEVQLQLVRALVNGRTPPAGRRDELLLVGDSAQTIYTGGLRLEELGGIRGRAIVLRRNHRNTKQIMRAAWACVGGFEVTTGDGGESVHRDSVDMEVLRSGPVPRLVRACDLDDQARYVVEQIKEYCVSTNSIVLDAGVLAYTNEQADYMHQHLRDADISSIRLCRDGPFPDNGVCVATFDRAKGLEFSVAFVVGMSADGQQLPRSPIDAGRTDGGCSEQEALVASRLYVAMTRARDVLHVCFDGQISPLLKAGLGTFDLVKTDTVIRHQRNLRRQ